MVNKPTIAECDIPKKIAYDIFGPAVKLFDEWKKISNDYIGWAALNAIFEEHAILRLLIKISEKGVAFTYIPFGCESQCVEVVYFYGQQSYVKDVNDILDYVNRVNDFQASYRKAWSTMTFSKDRPLEINSAIRNGSMTKPNS